MKFRSRPFVVEVKRGTSRGAYQSISHASEKISAAEALLFGAEAPVREIAAGQQSSQQPVRAGRVLPVLPDPVLVRDEPPPRRRGRKPGSKNKPKSGPASFRGDRRDAAPAVMAAEAATLGDGTRKLVLVNPQAMVLTGGSGADTVAADSGSNEFVAGTGSLDVTGGPDAASYVLHAGSGPLTVEDFDPGKGDTLAVDKTLQGALVQASDGHGGTLLAFGAKQGSIDLINHATVSPSAIRFI